MYFKLNIGRVATLITDPPPTRFTTLSEKEKNKEEQIVTCDVLHMTPDTR